MKIKTEKYLFYLENIALDKLLISQLLFAKYIDFQHYGNFSQIA